MRFVSFKSGSKRGLGVETTVGVRGVIEDHPRYPGSLLSLIAKGPDALKGAGNQLIQGPTVEAGTFEYLPPIADSGKVICVGLNYVDHSQESGFATPSYPALFARFNSSLIGHNQAIIRPANSDQLDYEGELVAVIGKTGKNIAEADALQHVAGYSIFNDGSIRDFQFKSPQWTPGKNFDATGAFGPCFVSADELPAGCKGLKLQTRLNGQVVQSAMIDAMVFSVASLVATLSEAMTLAPGDLIVTGTPSGVGLARKPPLYMKHGDVCEVEIDGLGVLRNPIRDQVPDIRSVA